MWIPKLSLASRAKKVLPNLISLQQTAYAENRFIGESSRLIADIIEVTDVLNKEGLLMDSNNGYPESLRFIRSYFCLFCIEKKLILVKVLLVGLEY